MRLVRDPGLHRSVNRMLRFGNAHLTSILSIGSFFLIWWAVVRVGLVSPTFLPSPFAIFPAARELLYTGELQADVLMSLARIGAGYATAAMLGVLLGLAMGLDDRVADILEPHFDVARQIPAVAWIPLAIIWFGFGEGTRIFIVFIGAFFPIVINTMAGVRNVDSQVLRAALPSIFTGFTVGLGSAFVNIVAAELAGATTGIGYAMLIAREAFRPDIVILGMVLLMVIGIALTGIMLAIRAHVLAWAVNG
jgi:sulfonate transport system permease protein